MAEIVRDISNIPRTARLGITVAFLSTFLDDPDWPVERISAEYGLTPAEIHAAWSYYYDHKDEIDDSIVEAEKLMHDIGIPVSIPENHED